MGAGAERLLGCSSTTPVRQTSALWLTGIRPQSKLSSSRYMSSSRVRVATETPPIGPPRGGKVGGRKTTVFVQVLGAIVYACEVCARHVAASVGC
eukprot:6212204-Pleurochrysis_carterae.AAC.3